MTVDEEIEEFISHFRNETAFIGSLKGDVSIPVSSLDPATAVAMHQKTLYSAVVDSLARFRYGKSLRNHDRFVKAVRDLGGWVENEHVSFPVLREHLAGLPAGALLAAVEKNLATVSMSRGGATPITAFDEPIGAVLQLAATPEEQAAARRCQHAELLYAYRNFIVHEFREPGYANEAFADGGSEPLYHSKLGPNQKWRLLYPANFFGRIAVAVRDSVEQWLKSTATNPYTLFKRTDAWYV